MCNFNLTGLGVFCEDLSSFGGFFNNLQKVLIDFRNFLYYNMMVLQVSCNRKIPSLGQAFLHLICVYAIDLAINLVFYVLCFLIY